MADKCVRLIQNSNFINPSEGEKKQFLSDVGDCLEVIFKYPALEAVTEYCLVFKALRDKICVKDFSRDGQDMAYRLMNIMNNELSDSKFSTLREPLHQLYMEFMIDSLKLGLRPPHVVIWDCMFYRHTGFYSYCEKFSEEKWREILSLLKKEYEPLPGEDKQKFDNQIEEAFKIIHRIEISEEMLLALQKDYVDMYLYWELSFLNRDDYTYRLHYGLGEMIWYKYKRSVFKNITDADFYRYCFKVFEKVLCNPEGPFGGKRLEEIHSIFDRFKTGLKDAKIFEEICEDSIDFVNMLIKKEVGPPGDKIFESITDYWSRLDNKGLKGKTEVFNKFAPKFITLLESEEVFTFKLIDSVYVNIISTTMDSKSKDHVNLWLKVLIHGLKNNQNVKGLYDALRDNEKVIKWKDMKDEAKQVMSIFLKKRIHVTDRWKQRDLCSGYNNLLEELIKGFKKAKILKLFVPDLVDYCLSIIEEKCIGLFEASKTAASDTEEINMKDHREAIFAALVKANRILKTPDIPWQEIYYAERAMVRVTENLLKAIGDGKNLTEEEESILVNLTLTILQSDFIDPEKDSPGGVYFDMMITNLGTLLKLLLTTGQLEKQSKIVELYLDLLAHEETEIHSRCGHHLNNLGAKSGPILAPYLGKLLEAFFDNEQWSLLTVIQAAYPENPKPMEEHFQKLFEYIESSEHSLSSGVAMLLPHIAKKQPQLFTEENIETVIETMYSGEPNYQSIFLMGIEPLAAKRPKLFTNQIDKFLERPYNEYAYYYLYKIIGTYGRKASKNDAEKIVKFFLEILRDNDDGNKRMQAVMEMKSLVSSHRPLVEKHRDFLEAKAKTDSNPLVKDQITAIIDVLEGRSLETLADDIEQQQDDITNIDSRVTVNENNINTVKEDVGKQSQKIKRVQKDVDDQGRKINVLGEVVEETKLKVEEIDKKTLSHAPYWSRDVSKLMNPAADADWRLLSSRLGYSNDDIRAWAQQSDPCMAMLNEWYATHKTSEASYGVLTALQEMDRMDAAIIVENAMKAAEQVVEDEEFEYESPPPIFLSYQWGHQDEVKLLRKHLEMAGYQCWMDIGQMGGGDKLFEKIDSGIRAAKIIISCTTEKYAKSPNCNREVNLSVNLKKPIIPLLLENCPWPPPGSMGPIFSEYLYIQFYQRSQADQTKDSRFWPPPKFQELLMQLSMNGVVPEESKVHKMYKNWWKPLVEEIKIDKTKTAGGGKTNRNQTGIQKTGNKENKSPEVFISYQWEKQKNVMLLYKKLTEMGYHCWMDIYQMGGGDSLYDKIDRGIRGSKVVLSCVTEKYSLSANCRREVSLCDALKRPIIPLLLEQMTWPPKGPMSMAFTELLYINFHSDPKAQEKWSGPKFEELMEKICEILPDFQPNEMKNSSSKNIPGATKKKGIVHATTTKPPQNKNENKSNTNQGVNAKTPKSTDSSDINSRKDIQNSSDQSMEKGNERNHKDDKSSSKEILDENKSFNGQNLSDDSQDSVKPHPQPVQPKNYPMRKIPLVKRFSPLTDQSRSSMSSTKSREDTMEIASRNSENNDNTEKEKDSNNSIENSDKDEPVDLSKPKEDLNQNENDDSYPKPGLNTKPEEDERDSRKSTELREEPEPPTSATPQSLDKVSTNSSSEDANPRNSDRQSPQQQEESKAKSPEPKVQNKTPSKESESEKRRPSVKPSEGSPTKSKSCLIL